MRILIAEDDFISRRFLYKFFSQYGTCDVIADGDEALRAFMFALDENEPYDLICLDVMMPKLNGLQALSAISEMEKERGIAGERAAKKFVITALSAVDDINRAYEKGCQVYVTKPVNTEKLLDVMKKLNLIG